MGQKWTCGVFAWPCLAVEKPIVRCRGVMDGEESRGCGRVTAAVSGLAACLAACCPTAGPKLANPCKWLAGRDGVRCGLQWLRPVDTVDGREPSLHGTNLKAHTKTQSASFVSRSRRSRSVNICVNFPFPVMPAQTTMVSQMQYKLQSLIKVMHAPKFQSHR